MDNRKSQRWLKRAARALLWFLLFMVLFRWFEHAQVYRPGREVRSSGADLGRAFEEVRLQTADGVDLHGWFYPATTNATAGGYCFLVCHGNGGNIGHRLGLAAALLRTGASVLLFDYRGYGRSEGRPSEEGTYRDAQACHRWLRDKGFAADRILAFGESLGGAVATELACRETVGGLVLQSTFTSIPDLGSELMPWLPVRWLGTIRYDTRSKLPGLKVPVLLLHSRTDDLIGFHHAERNFAAARDPKQLVELEGGHNDSVYDQPRFGEALANWLASLSPGSSRQ